MVSVSSRARLNSPVVFDDIDFARRAYDPALAYAQSTTANVLFAVAAARRWADEGIEVDALHPGAIADSGLSRHLDRERLAHLRTSGRYTYETLAEGAATSVVVATSPALDGIVGCCFENCRQADPDVPAAAGVAPFALDRATAEHLWTVYEQLNT